MYQRGCNLFYYLFFACKEKYFRYKLWTMDPSLQAQCVLGSIPRSHLEANNIIVLPRGNPNGFKHINKSRKKKRSRSIAKKKSYGKKRSQSSQKLKKRPPRKNSSEEVAVTEPPSKKRRSVATLQESGNRPTGEVIQILYGFMSKREAIRIRKDVKQMPQAVWTTDATMKDVHFTNVRREHDRTTKAFRTVVNDWIEQRPELNTVSWHRHHPNLAGLLVFNYGLLRAFGNDKFGQRLGFQEIDSCGDVEKRHVVDVAMQHWSAKGFCYTAAHKPNSVSLGLEKRCKSVDETRAIYESTCATLDSLWKSCVEIGTLACNSGSWRKATEQLMQVKGYGGTGFLAKEIMQDVLQTPIFRIWEASTKEWVSKHGFKLLNTTTRTPHTSYAPPSYLRLARVLTRCAVVIWILRSSAKRGFELLNTTTRCTSYLAPATLLPQSCRRYNSLCCGDLELGTICQARFRTAKHNNTVHLIPRTRHPPTSHLRSL